MTCLPLRMKAGYLIIAPLFVLTFLLCFRQYALAAAGPDCTMCHGDLTKGKVVHAAVSMGCSTCHEGIDAAKMPHAKTNKIAKGLSAEQPDLCYGCHDRKKFTGKFIHAPVGIGMCTSCHDPHRSQHEKLLLKPAPDLCFGCHDKKEFGKKVVHAPVAGGLCLSCHGPHAAEEFAVLKKDAVELCLDCHAQVRKRPHALTGLSSAGHPVGIPRKGKMMQDPARPGKRFYCGSCHNPHSAESKGMLRGDAVSVMMLCVQCHKK